MGVILAFPFIIRQTMIIKVLKNYFCQDLIDNSSVRADLMKNHVKQMKIHLHFLLLMVCKVEKLKRLELCYIT